MVIGKEEVIEDLVYKLGHWFFLLELHPVESLYVLIGDYWLVHGGSPLSMSRMPSLMFCENQRVPLGLAWTSGIEFLRCGLFLRLLSRC